ncbi:hypothetical protein ACH4U6_06120 [Streptomyces netropsis]|uniref:hypothetical protein n=1 Tax=Streptomyces netropsis TaxID=55404 RepID=UPI0037A1B86D
MTLLRAFEDSIRVEKHLFALVDEECEADDVYVTIPGVGGMATEADVVVVSSALEDQLARLRVEVWAGLPQLPQGEWRRVSPDLAVQFSTGRVRVVNLLIEPETEDWALCSPGTYSVRVFVSGPEEPVAQAEAGGPFERYVVQLWSA